MQTTFKKFPEEDCTWVTEHVFIHKPRYTTCLLYDVWLRSGDQYFSINPTQCHSWEEAQWWAQQIVAALEKIQDAAFRKGQEDMQDRCIGAASLPDLDNIGYCIRKDIEAMPITSWNFSTTEREGQ